MSNNIYSYHNFLFPFRFDKIIGEIGTDRHKYYKDNLFDDRVKIDDIFCNSLDSDGWEYKQHDIKTNLDYNEFTYFHDFSRDTLFNTAKEFKESATSYYFEKKVETGSSFQIDIAGKKSYSLSLVGLSLRIFDTGVGILSIELENRDRDHHSIDDILKINDFGRRIYPQFLGREDDKSDWTQATKDAFLPDSITVCLNGDRTKEKFNYEEIPEAINISPYILELLGKNTFTTDKSQNGKNFIQPSVDDRMFIICWYGHNEWSEKLKDYKYATDDKWYEYVFVDGNGKTVHSPKMQGKLIEEATYDRWMNYEDGLTLFGMSRYSFVALSNEKWFAKNILPLPHMKTMYYQMFTLLLAQRASILRFSDEVTALSDIDQNRLENQISNLYKNYIRFVNKLYFREITPQDQGIEIYNRARAILNIDNDIKDLDKEIDELYRYASMLEENERTAKMDRLTRLGYIFLPATFVAGFFGMNTFGSGWLDNVGGFVLSVALIGCATWFVARRNGIEIREFFTKEKNERK